MGFLKKELQPGLCVSLRERPLPSIFQNTGFGNGKSCWTTPDTPGLADAGSHPLPPPPPPPPPPPREIILDQRMIIHQSFLSMPPPPPVKKRKKTYGDGWGWSGQGAGQLEFVCPCSAGGFNTGTVIFVILFFLLSGVRDGFRCP